MFVYADNAATTQMSDIALEAMKIALDGNFGNPSSFHSFGRKAKSLIEDSRRNIADCICAKSSEIYFTSCGSESDNQAIYTACNIGKSLNKNHIIATAFEHKAVLKPLEFLSKNGFDVTYISPDKDGYISASDIENNIRKETFFVTCMMANNEIGTIQPIREISTICHKKSILFHTYAVQAAGHIKIDVNDLDCDFLSFSAHKFHGPKGAAVLYSKKRIEPINLILGGGQERGKRAGTENTPAIYSMACAFKEACDNLNVNYEKQNIIRNKILNELLKIPKSSLNGNLDNRLPNNINIRFDDVSNESLLMMLDMAGIAVSAGSACESGSLEPSHVLKSIGLKNDQISSSIRITISEYTTEKEADYLIEKVKESVEKIRNIKSKG